MRRARWWLSVASIALVGTAVVQVAAVSAQDTEESTLRVERVDARGDEVVIEGVAPGVDPATIEVTSGDDAVDVTSAATVGSDDLDHEVVAVIDNAEALGNAVVQLAKQGLEPLFPGQGAATTLGVVSTGGQATIDVGPTSSVARLEAGLAGIEPEGGSATWDGIVRAAELLEGRSSRSLGTVVLFSASPATAATSVPARAEAALERAGASLQVIALADGGRGRHVQPHGPRRRRIGAGHQQRRRDRRGLRDDRRCDLGDVPTHAAGARVARRAGSADPERR